MGHASAMRTRTAFATRACWSKFLCAVAFSLLPARADADVKHEAVVDLTWIAPSGCPDKEAVTSAILGLIQDTGSIQQWHARAEVEGTGDLWTLRLVTELDGGKQSVRVMQAPSCTE